MSEPQPRLLGAPADGAASGVVLLLHGGQEHSRDQVRRRQLAVLRMVPVARAVRRRAARQIVVARLLYRYRGWNAPQHPALQDARWALAECRNRFGPGVPISLIGHSMGGRVALRIAGEPNVRSVVALAPWLPAHEPPPQVAGRRLLLVHGTADRTTDPGGSARLVAAAQGAAESISYLRSPGEGHALLRHGLLVDGLAAAFALATLDSTSLRAGRTEHAQISNLLRKALAGEVDLVR